MSEHLTQTLTELKNAIIEDGVVDADEVEKLRERIFKDSKIDKQEAELLFQINNAVSGRENDPGWQELFVSVVSNFVLMDLSSPGEIDESEAAWLIGMMQGDGRIDQIELALLKEISERAQKVDSKLQAIIDSHLPS